MKSENFIYWLQGMFELTNPETLNKEQTHLIKQHLALVFVHEIDPAMGDDKKQALLNAIHNRPPYRPHIPIVPYNNGRDASGELMRC